MTTWFKEACVGGLFQVPGWNLAFAAENRFALLFDGGSTTHRVTPPVPVSSASLRLGIVYYASCKFRGRGTPAEEIARANRIHDASGPDPTHDAS